MIEILVVTNINEAIRVVLNFLLLFFFYEKISQAQKAQKAKHINKRLLLRYFLYA